MNSTFIKYFSIIQELGGNSVNNILMSIKKRNKLIALCLSVLLLSQLSTSCASLRALSFQKSDVSGITTKQSTRLFKINPIDNESDTFNIAQQGPAITVLNKGIETCKIQETDEEIVPSLIPIVVAGGTLIFKYITDALASKVKQLQQASQKTSSANVLLDRNISAKGTDCLLMVRYADTSTGSQNNVTINDIGMAALFQKQTVRDAYAWKLIYLYYANSLAITEATDPPRINVAFAIAGKAVEKKNNKSAVLKNIGASTMNLKGVPIGTNKPIIDCVSQTPTAICGHNMTDLFLGVQSDSKGATSYSIGLTETGSAYGQFDTAEAELKALNAALGPAIGASIKTLLTE